MSLSDRPSRILSAAIADASARVAAPAAFERTEAAPFTSPPFFERGGQGPSGRRPRRERLFRFKGRPELAGRLLAETGRVERAAEQKLPVGLETDGRGRSQAHPPHRGRDVLPAQVVAGEEKGDARFPGSLFGPDTDRLEGLFRFRPASRLEELGRPGERGVEIEGGPLLTHVGPDKGCSQESERGNEREPGDRAIG